MVHSIEHLNTDCTCVTLDLKALCAAAEEVVGDPAFCRDLAVSHPHLLAAHPMFVSSSHAQRMQAIIRAIETVAATEGYRAAVLGSAGAVSRYAPGPIGVFMGYDFHLGQEGPKLIEINTNAGGALLNAYLLQAQRACCGEMASSSMLRFDLAALLASFIASFRDEWRRQGRTAALRSIAIVDVAPQTQYLYPEFVLFQRLFAAHGFKAHILAPDDLQHRDGALWSGAERIDFVYNRLTDFDLSTPASAALRAAYLTGDVVVSPNPHAHALYANKLNLVLLTDRARLEAWGVDAQVIETLLDGIPRTEVVRAADPEALWARRGNLFFKPASGFGGKATYRGDKITRKVWADILSGDYVAQALVQPSARAIEIDGKRETLKADLRNYTYDGAVQLIAARLYQGQTTNFRTPGGGFAPVFIGP